MAAVALLRLYSEGLALLHHSENTFHYAYLLMFRLTLRVKLTFHTLKLK